MSLSAQKEKAKGRFINKKDYFSYDECGNSSRHLQSLSRHVFRSTVAFPEAGNSEIVIKIETQTGFPSRRRCWRTTQVVIALFFVSILTSLLVTVVRVLDVSDKLNLWYSRSLTRTDTAGSNDVTSFETYFLKISKFRDWIASCNESNAFKLDKKGEFQNEKPFQLHAWAVFLLQRHFLLQTWVPIWSLTWLLQSWNFGFANSSHLTALSTPSPVQIYLRVSLRSPPPSFSAARWIFWCSPQFP